MNHNRLQSVFSLYIDKQRQCPGLRSSKNETLNYYIKRASALPLAEDDKIRNVEERRGRNMICYAVIDTNVLVSARQMLDILDGKG